MTLPRWALAPEDEALAPAACPGARRVLCVDPTGERCLAWAAAGAEVWQLADACGRALLELKLAVGVLAWEEAMQVLGLLTGGRRVFLYHRARPGLSAATRAFWDAHEAWIRQGVLHQATGEQALARWRRGLDLLGVGRAPAALGGRRAALLGRLVLAPEGLPADLAARCAALAPSAPNPWLGWVLRGALEDPDPPRASLSREAHAAGPALRGRIHALEGPPPGGLDVLDLGPAAPPEGVLEALAPGGVVLAWGSAPAGWTEDPRPLPPSRSPLWGPPRRLLGAARRGSLGDA